MNWKSFFDALGINDTEWRWRMMRWERQVRDLLGSFRQQGQTVTYRHKFCDECGSLMDREDKSCPRCGARAASWRGQSIRRALGLWLPARSAVASVLIGLNLLLFLWVLLHYGVQYLMPGSAEPRAYMQMLFDMGALVPARFLQGEWFRLFTYGFLHVGLIHIAFNMIALSQVGFMLEDDIGPARFFTLYMLSMVSGGLADILVRGAFMGPIAGASGALFGLIGFGVSYGHFYGGPSGQAQRNFFLRWALYGFVFGLMVPGIDNICHAGGFAAGAVLGFLVEREGRLPHSLLPLWRTAAMLAALVTLVAFGALLAA